MTLFGRRIAVYVCATPSDMDAEREALEQLVFPALRKRFSDRGVEVVKVDPAEDVAARLAAIDACRPFFIALVGERYGQIAPPVEELLKQHPWLADCAGRSEFELEILHGVLNNPAAARASFFYFRDPRALSLMPPPQQSEHVEQDPEAARRLRELKERIRKSGRPVMEDYSCQWDAAAGRLVGLEAWAQRVHDDLVQAIEAELAEHAGPGGRLSMPGSPETPPSPTEVEHKLNKIQEALSYQSPVQAQTMRTRAKRINQRIEQARASGDSPKLIEAFNELEDLLRCQNAVPPALNPPWEDYEGLLADCRHLAEWLEKLKPEYPVAQTRKHLDTQREAAQRAYNEQDQQMYGEYYGRLQETHDGLEREVESVKIDHGPRPSPEEQAEHEVADLSKYCSAFEQRAANCAAQFARRAESPPEGETPEMNHAHQDHCRRCLEELAGCKAALEKLRPQTGTDAQGVLSECRSHWNVLFRLQTVLNKKATILLGKEPEQDDIPLDPTTSRESTREPYWDENVQFTVFRPKAIPPEKWCKLAASAHLEEKRPDAPPDAPEPKDKARAQAEAQLGIAPEDIREATQDAGQAIPQGGEITFVPQMDGVRFNPPRQSFLWEEDEHTVTFRMRASAELDGKVARGRMGVFLGVILVADVPLKIEVRRDAATRKAQQAEPVSASRYRKIFASYSHRDLPIVEQFERYAEALGDEYLRDWKKLRSGERWSERLLEMIDEADVFQLFWSRNSMDSPYVRREWERALRRADQEGFIRPVYWEESFPERPPDLPPPALARFHFQRICGSFGSHVPSSTAAPVDGGWGTDVEFRTSTAESIGGPPVAAGPAPGEVTGCQSMEPETSYPDDSDLAEADPAPAAGPAMEAPPGLGPFPGSLPSTEPSRAQGSSTEWIWLLVTWVLGLAFLAGVVWFLFIR